LQKHPELRTRSAIWLLLNLGQVPEVARTAVHHNAGGHVNHSMFWRAMFPGESGEPGGALGDAIRRDFGDPEKFRALFDAAAEKVFGSGWVWLAKTQREGGRLEILTSSGHDNPLMQGLYPILVNDVWEHAYYLKHENRRADYLKGWWSVVNWKEAERRFEASALPAERRWDSDGGLAL
jgi:Fe-Mn family superoxide dismutase